jgi:hypothetical protein
MSIVLSEQTEPPHIEAKTHDVRIEGKQLVRIGKYFLPFEDFFVLVRYVMTNTDLEGPDDPRVKFLETMKQLKKEPGFSKWVDKGSRAVRYVEQH